MPRSRFATIPQDGWRPLDQVWLEYVRRRARFLWVRVVGLGATCGEPLLSDPSIKRWESAATRYTSRTSGKRTCAYLWVWFGRNRKPYIRDRTGLAHRGDFVSGTEQCRQRWRLHDERLPPRIAELFGELRQSVPHPIGVFSEDFSSRWLMLAGVRPDVHVMDNPMVSTAEAEASGLLASGKVFVRSSDWRCMLWSDDWKLPFDIEARLVGEPSRRRHGDWSTYGDGIHTTSS